MTSPGKIHVGLISADKTYEPQIKEALDSSGGGYIHQAKGLLEMYGKLGMQKIQMLIYIAPDGENGSEAQAIVNFFRSKPDYKKLPICIFTQTAQVEMKRLISDPRVRGFSLAGGMFLGLISMLPIVHASDDSDLVQTVNSDWISREFLLSAKEKLGQGIDLSSAVATDDEMHTGFFCQNLGEVRSHLGWFKFGARILEGNNDGLAKVFAGMSKDQMEEVAQMMLNKIVEDFVSKVNSDLVVKGAIFYPPIENLQPPEKKILYSSSKTKGLIFKSGEISILLEVIQYI